MANNAYYFSHDSNAKDDPKCMLLIDQLGLEGYGIFWILIEVLRDQPEYKYPISLIPILARRYNTTAEKMSTVIKNYGLFNFDEQNNFFSLSLNKRMNKIQNSIEQRRMAGLASAEKRKYQLIGTTVERPLNECSTKKRKEKKGNEIIKEIYKEKNRPTIDELIDYCKERGNKVDANKFYDFYESKGWYIGKNKMKDWKAAVRTWEKSSTEQVNKQVTEQVRKPKIMI